MADLAKERVPYQVMTAYRLDHLQFGPDYFIPKPFDPRVLIWEASSVAKAAMDSGVARIKLDIAEYRERLEARLGFCRKVFRGMINKAKAEPKRIVYPEGDHPPILKACETILDEGMARPILLGPRDKIESLIERLSLRLKGGVEIIDPRNTDRHDHYEQELYRLRQRHGVTRPLAHELMIMRKYFSAMMVHLGDADGMVSGLTTNYPDTLTPALQIMGSRAGVGKPAAMHILVLKDRVLFFADVTINVLPSAEDLADIAVLCAAGARRFEVEPRVAMVSFSNFGGVPHAESEKVRQAVALVRQRAPGLLVDGEMQADVAVTPYILERNFPFTCLKDGAHVLIFPCLDSSSAAHLLLQRLGGAEAIGPILLGMDKPVHILQFGGSNEVDVVNMTALAVVDAQGTSDTSRV